MVASECELAQWQLVALPERFEILDAAATSTLVTESEPDVVLHLAGLSSVAQSLGDPDTTLRVNVLGTLNLLQALKAARFAGTLLYVSSGDVYGQVAERDLPINETHLPAPRSPYAVSKLAGESLCYQWWVTEGLRVVIARPFNHIGPGQSNRFAIAAFASQIGAIRRGERPPVVDVGDIDVTRDFTDVRDIVWAYFALLAGGTSGERYNVCSGCESSVRDTLERMIELAGVTAEIRQDPSRLRPAEQRRVVGDPAKIRADTGWQPTVSLDASLKAVLNAA